MKDHYKSVRVTFTRWLMSLAVLTVLWTTNANAQYFSENFEAAFTGSGATAAPSGWAQTSIDMQGNTATQFWAQGTLAAGVFTPNLFGTEPTLTRTGAATGKVLLIDDGNLTPSSVIIRRIVTPSISTASATSPYVRCWFAANNATTNNNVRMIGSADGGATWVVLKFMTSNGNVAAATVGLSSGWEAVNVKLPASFVGNSNIKIGFECTGTFGSNGYLIDDLSIDEFTPTTITSNAVTGNWNAPASWIGGVVPTGANHVVIASGATITNNIDFAGCQDLTVTGTLINAGSANGLLRVYGNLTVNSTGFLYNASATGTAATGRCLSVGGNILNNGRMIFQSSATAQSSNTLYFNGCGGANYSGSGLLYDGTGTAANGRIAVLACANSGGVTFSNPVTINSALGLIVGTFNPTNVTIGGALALSSTFTTIAWDGTQSTGVTYNNTNIASRALTYAGGASTTLGSFINNRAITNAKIITGGDELYGNAGNAVTGTLTMTTPNNLQLSGPATIGQVTTGGLTLTRGLIITTATNLLTLNCGVATFAGTAPSTTNPNPTTQGSYIVGPLRMIYPTSGTTNRAYPLGLGTALNPTVNGNTPTSNRLATLTVGGSPTWAAGMDFTASIDASVPTGSVAAPGTLINSVTGFRLQKNGATDLPAAATIQLTGNNYTFGNSDNMQFGNVEQLCLLQGTSISGPWTGRTAFAAGTTAFGTNTNRLVTSAAAAPGPIAPIATNGEYFTIGTSTPLNLAVGTIAAVQSTGNVFKGTNNNIVMSVNIPVTGVTGNGTLTLNSFTATDLLSAGNGGNTNATTDITGVKLWSTGTASTFTSPVLVAGPSTFSGGVVAFSGLTRNLPVGNNYFWITYDVAIGATSADLLDFQIAAGGIVISETAPATPPGTQPPALINPSGTLTVGALPALAYNAVRTTGASFSSIIGTPGAASMFTSTQTSNDDITSPDLNLTTAFTPAFSFNYQGSAVTAIRANSNGWLGLTNTTSAPTTSTSVWTNTLGNLGTKNIITPFWDDLKLFPNVGGSTTCTGCEPNLSYKITGTSPDRVLTIEWLAYSFGNTGADVKFNFQIKLYEAGGANSNKVEFVYGNMTIFDGVANFGYTYSAGLQGGGAVTATNGNTFAQQVENTNLFANTGTGTTGTGAEGLSAPPTCYSSIVFDPLTSYGGGTALPAVTNDECAGAIPLTLGTAPPTSYCNRFYSQGATNSNVALPAGLLGTNPDDDVWFSFTVTGTNDVTVFSPGEGGYNVAFEVFSGTCGSLVSIGSRNAFGDGLKETLPLPGLTNGTYYIRVFHTGLGFGTTASTKGYFALEAYKTPVVPSNDNSSGAAALTVGSTCVDSYTAVYTNGATASPEGICGGTPDDDVWYKFTAIHPTTTVTVTGLSTFDAQVEVFDAGVSPGVIATMTSLSCTNNTATGAETVNVSTIPGYVYYVRVYHSVSGASLDGSFNICAFSTAPATPSCTSLNTPANLATGQAYTGIALTWNTTTNAFGGYNVYLGTTNPPTTLLTNVPYNYIGAQVTTANTGLMSGNTVYYWMVVPVSFTGTEATGPCTVNSFTTNNPCTINPTAGSSTANPGNVCYSNVAATLTVSGYSTDVGISLQWQSSLTPGGPYTDISGANAATYSVTSLTATTYYVCKVICSFGGFSLTNEVSVVYNNPSITGTTPGFRCGPGTVTLQATASAGATLTWYTAPTGGTSVGTGSPFTTSSILTTTPYYVAASLGGGAGLANIGTGTVQNGTSTTTDMPPYGNYYTGNRHQMLVLASELTAAGLVSGSAINSLSFDVISSLNALGYAGFTIKLGHTAASALTTTFETSPTTQVYTIANYGNPVAGWNQHLFSTPFTWDGSSNLLVETYFTNCTSCSGTTCSNTGSGISYTENAVTNQTTLGFTGHTWYYSDAAGCSPETQALATTSSLNRPNMRFGFTSACESARTLVNATINTTPSITQTASLTSVCNGGLSVLNVSSVNDPNYTYSWSSIPAGFTATGPGPHNINPTITRDYVVNAIDNTAGPFAGCTNVSTVTVTALPAVSTISSSQPSICTSGSAVLSLTPATGYPTGSIQWQDSPTGAIYTAIGGANSATYSTGVLTSTTYYKAVISNSASVVCSQPTFTQNIYNPTVSSTTPGSRCGAGTVTLGAVAGGVGSVLNWYNVPTGGTSIGTGTSFTTPVLNSSANYYVEASAGGGTLTGLGYEAVTVPTTTGASAQRGIVFDAYQAFTLVSAQYYSPTLNVTNSVTVVLQDNTGTQLNTVTLPVVQGASAGWYTLNINFPINPGTGYRLLASFTASVNRFNTGADYSNIAWNNLGPVGLITSGFDGLANSAQYNYFHNISITYGCISARTTVAATITPSTPISASSALTTVCSGSSTTISVSSINPNYTYSWTSTPAGFTATGVGPHTVTPVGTSTTYSVLAFDPNDNCGALDNVTISTTTNNLSITATANPSAVCNGGNSQLNAIGLAGAAPTAYSFAPSSGSFTPITGGTVVPAIQVDDAISGTIPIGFTFNYGGSTYTDVVVSSNGVIFFGTTGSSTTAPNLSTLTPRPFLAVLADDMDGISGTASYTTTGTSGNRVFTFEWLNWEWYFSVSGGPTISIQCKLYEATGNVEYIYRQEAGPLSGVSEGAVIGIAGVSTGVFISLNDASAAPVPSTTVETTTINTKPASGQIYRFSPPAPPVLNYSWSPSTFLTATNISNPIAQAVTASQTYVATVTDATSGCFKTTNVPVNLITVTASNTSCVTATKLSWPDNAPNGYMLYVGTAPGVWTVIPGQDVSGTTSITLPILQANTTYYYELNPVVASIEQTGCTTGSFLSGSSVNQVPNQSVNSYKETLDNGIVPPAIPCGMTSSDENFPADGFTWYTSTIAPKGGTRHLRIDKNTNNTTPKDDWFYSAPMNLTAGRLYRIYFWHRVSTAGSESFEAYLGSAPDAATMQANSAIFVGNSNSVTYKLDSSANILPTITGVYYYGFRANGAANGRSLYMDEIQVKEIPVAALDPASCTTLASMYDQILVQPIYQAQDYKFLIENLATSFSYEYTRNLAIPDFRLKWAPGVTYGLTYDVSVSYKKNNVWSAYGLPCPVTMGPFPTTKLRGASCGAIITDQYTQLFYDSVAGANDYEIKIVQNTLAYDHTWTRGGSQLDYRMYWAYQSSPTLVDRVPFGFTYDVQVRALVGRTGPLNGNLPGTFGTFGPVCTVQLLGQPQTQLVAAPGPQQSCGKTLVNLNDPIYCIPVTGASNYRYRVVNLALGYDVTTMRNSAVNDFRLTWLPTAGGNGIRFGTTYDITVEDYVGGVWSAPGPVCQVTTPASPLTSLQPAYCPYTLPTFSTPVYSTTVIGATNYRYRITDQATNGTVYTKIVDRNSPGTDFRFSWTLVCCGGLNMLPNTAYKVEVASYAGGVWSGYGSVCVVTTGASVPRYSQELAEEGLFNASSATALSLNVYPNPAAVSQEFAVELNGIEKANETVLLDIYNVLGERVYRSQIITKEESRMVIKPEQVLAPGVYTVEARLNGSVKRVKFVVQ